MRVLIRPDWAGVSVVEVCRVIEVTQPTYHRWRQQYGGMQGEEARRLTQRGYWVASNVHRLAEDESLANTPSSRNSPKLFLVTLLTSYRITF